jgi:F0F1-type ATP synthase membrane subunit c/vacuolar-type H+-ATPase subunit K
MLYKWLFLFFVCFLNPLLAESNSSSHMVVIGVGIAAAGAAIGMGLASSKAMEALGRNPSVGNFLVSQILGLVFIEVAVILTFTLAIIKG